MMSQATNRTGRTARSLALAAAMVTGSLIFGSTAFDAKAANVLETGESSLTIETNRGVLVRLDRPAADVFIADSSIADVQVKSPRIIYIYGRSVGETVLFVLDDEEQVIYSAEINVTHNIERLTNAIRSLLPNAVIDVQSVSGMLVLTGNVKTPAEAEMIQSMIAQPSFSGARVINRISVSTPTQVNLRVKIVEASRDVLKTLGFKWEAALATGDVFFGLQTGEFVDLVPNPFGTGTGPIEEFTTLTNGTNSIFGDIVGGKFDLNYLIDALETEGFVSILAEPNITAISGETASFLAGGEFPIPTPQSFGNVTIQFKEFGVGVSFTPTVLSENQILLKVAPEVSQLSSAGAVVFQGVTVPAISTRRASTTIELGSGQSFAIAGLLQNTITQDVSKFPGLANIPILGALFKSDRFRSQQTELVILVTPYIVEPFDARAAVTPIDGYRAPNDPSRYLRGETHEQVGTRSSAPYNVDAAGNLVGGAGFRLGKK